MDEINLGKVPRDTQKARGLTLKNVADKLKISFDYVSRIEKGDREPSDIVKAAIDEFISSNKNSPDGCAHVDIYNMVSGGNGVEPEWHEPIDHRTIPASLLKNGIRPVLVRGRSMEPTFKNAAVIGVNENDHNRLGHRKREAAKLKGHIGK